MRPIIFVFSFLMMVGLSSCATRIEMRPKTVTLVKTLPKNHKIVRVNGKRYYFWNGNNYRKTRNGYTIIRL